MFNYDNEFSEEQKTGFQHCEHLRDTALSLGVDCSAFLITQDLEAESFAAIAAALRESIAEACLMDQRNREPECHIGPFAGNYCEICGLRQEGTQS